MKFMISKALLLSAILVSMSGCFNTPTTTPGTSTGSNEGSNGSSGVGGGEVTPPSTETPSTGGDSTPGGVTGSDGSSTPVDPSTGGGGVDSSTCDAALVPITYAGTISINNGAPYTATRNVSLQIQRDQALKMKVSLTADCRCGTWEDYAPSKNIDLAGVAGSQPVSVQFKDYDNSVSQCATARINLDNLAPVIAITADSSNAYGAGDSSSFSFTVADPSPGAGVGSCKVKSSTGTNQDCNLSNGVGSVSFANQAAGSYTLEVTAADVLGNSATQKITWTMKAAYRSIAQSYAVKAENKVDILFVIDNSGSMEYEQQSMAARMSNFMSQINGLDYKIAVTTTDPSNQTYGAGNIVKIKGLTNQYVITPDLGLATAQKVLGDTVQRTETGSGSEQGIYGTYRAIERSIAATASPNKGFFRDGAGLAVVLISDEDESATAPKNIPANLVSLVKNTWTNKNFAFHSIITRPNDSICKKTYGATYGTVYAQMSALTGGIVGDVCASDYGSQLAGMGQSVQQMVKTIALDCAPIGDVRSSVQVKLNGSAYAGSYEVQGTKLVFDANLPAGDYALSYQCL
jgi:hypothetical protein